MHGSTPISGNPLPLHFKLPGRSYSQIGRKGNVALYAVYSDYFSLPDFALPYIIIGFELIVIKTNRLGLELYPADWQFGKLAWSIPKSLQRVSRTSIGRCLSNWTKLCISEFKTFLNRSPASEASSPLATTANGCQTVTAPAY